MAGWRLLLIEDDDLLRHSLGEQLAAHPEIAEVCDAESGV